MTSSPSRTCIFGISLGVKPCGGVGQQCKSPRVSVKDNGIDLERFTWKYAIRHRRTDD